MIRFDRSDAQRITVSLAGALLFSTLCIGVATVPANAATIAVAPSSMTETTWQTDAGRRLDRAMASVPATVRNNATRNAEIVADVAADGHVSTPRIERSSGSAVVDAALLRRVRTLHLAPLPAASTRTTVLFRVVCVDDYEPNTAPVTTRLAVR